MTKLNKTRLKKRYFCIVVAVVMVLCYLRQKSFCMLFDLCHHAGVAGPENIFTLTDNGTLLKILFYTSSMKSKVDFETDHYMFNTCNLAPPSFTEQNTRSQIFDARLKHFVRCSTGYDVVIFHVKDMPGPKLLRTVQAMQHGARNQLWAYYNKESAFNTINLMRGRFDGIFNLAITPLRTSDVQASYGYYHPRPNPTDYDLAKDSIVLDKDLTIAWIASHCNEERDTIVASLMRYFPVHVFGKCGLKFNQNRVCVKNSTECEKLLGRYKFVLAFENSLCKDYVTEKYWNAVSRGNIPIVYGGSNYDDVIVVPGSFINVRDFKSIDALAKHVLAVDKTFKYFKYHQWRKLYVIDYKPNDRHRFEIITRKLYELLLLKGVEREKTYNLSTFYGRKQNCEFHQSIKSLISKN